MRLPRGPPPSSWSPAIPGVTKQQGLGLTREPWLQTLWSSHQREFTLSSTIFCPASPHFLDKGLHSLEPGPKLLLGSSS